MKNVLKITLLAIGLSTFTLAKAEDGFYFGVAGAKAEFKEGGVPNIKQSAVVLKVGDQLNENFAVEARLGTGLNTKSENLSPTTSVERDINYFGSLYGKAIAPLNSNISLYALAGYTGGEVKTNVKVSGVSSSVTDSFGDFSYGFGVDLNASKKGPFSLLSGVTINLEWARIYSMDGLNISTFSLGVNRKF